MKSLLTILFLLFITINGNCQDTPLYTFGKVQFMSSVPGTGENKMKRMANTIQTYLEAIEEDQYATWYETFSDSTISRVAPHKFPNKFRRLKEYKLTTEVIKVVSVERVSPSFENETGTEYKVIIEVSSDMNVANRVSFDHLKRGKENANARLFGINIVTSDKGYKICVHKYTTTGAGDGSGNR